MSQNERHLITLHGVPATVLLDLVHGPARMLLQYFFANGGDKPSDIWVKIREVSNQLHKLLETANDCIEPTSPFRLFLWSLDEHQNETDVLIHLLEHMDCLNNPEQEFYRNIMVDLLKVRSEEDLIKVYRKVERIHCQVYPSERCKIDWSAYKTSIDPYPTQTAEVIKTYEISEHVVALICHVCNLIELEAYDLEPESINTWSVTKNSDESYTLSADYWSVDGKLKTFMFPIEWLHMPDEAVKEAYNAPK